MATARHQTAFGAARAKAQNVATIGARVLRIAAEYSRPSDVSVEAAVEAASAHRRRLVIDHLADVDGGVELTDLAELVAAAENGVRVADLTPKERKRVYVSLYQTHVPTLESLGFVEYADETGIVHPTQALHDVASWLDDATLRFNGGGL